MGLQWVFPAVRPWREPRTGLLVRHHLHESVVQRAVRDAVRAAAVPKRATSTHVLDRGAFGVRSPIDRL